MKFDDIVVLTGEFGPYQRKIYFLVCLIGIPVAMHLLAQVFLAGDMEHWCREKDLDDEMKKCSSTKMPEQYLDCINDLKRMSIPDPMEPGENLKEFDSCHKYNMSFTDYVTTNASIEDIKIIQCNEGWVYDRSQFMTSIVSDFNLVCDKKKYPALSQSIFFAGVLVGSFGFGALADTIGRFLTFFIAIGILAVFGILTAFSNGFWMFTILRFIIAAADMGSFLVAFVIGTELVGPSKRVIAGIVIQIFFAIGYMMYALLAMFIRDWRVLQIVITVPVFFLFLLIPFISESPRWLLSKKSFDKAEKLIRNMAKANKAEDKLPSNFMQQLEATEKLAAAEEQRMPSFIDLYRTPKLRIQTINLMYNWFVNSFVYYGLSLSTSDLGSDIYVAFFISGAVEVPAYFLSIVAVESVFGRRFSVFGFEMLGGVACLCTIFLPLGTLRTAVAMIGKFAIAASFSIVYIFAAELFPTPLRSVGVGICSTSARVGGILAPVILMLSDVWQPLPLLVFGLSCIIAGFLILLLPETRGRALPETVLEGENFGRNCELPQIQSQHSAQEKWQNCESNNL